MTRGGVSSREGENGSAKVGNKRRRFGNVKLLPHGVYRIRWVAADGSRQQETGMPTLDLAELRLAAIEREMARAVVFGEEATIEPIRFRVYAPAHLERLKTRGYSPESIKSYRKDLRMVGRLIGDKYLHQVNRTVGRRVRDRLSVTETGRPCSGYTINRRMAAASSLFREAIEDGHAVANPFSKLTKAATKQREFDFLGFGARRELLGKILRELRPAAEFSMETGLRQGEMMRLRWEDIDLTRDPGMLIVHISKNKKPRRVSLTARAREVIEGIEMTGEYVFPWRDRDQGFSYLWAQSQAAAEIKGRLRWHDFRHVYAATCAHAGISAPEIARLLGTSVKTALRYMDHAPDNYHERAVEKLERLRQGG